MPYISEDDKHKAATDSLNGDGAANPGTLTYELQQTICEYLLRHGLRYQQIAEVLGSLEGARLDFIERVVKPYEHNKRLVNGDVWPAHLTGVNWDRPA